MFLAFIKHLKSHLNSKNVKWLVIGNESSDLDSVVCSLVYAYCIQKTLQDNCQAIPVCSIPKNKMVLKKDVIKWLEMFGIITNIDLVFLEDIQHILNDENSESPVNICLVDHHKPQLSVMCKYIKEIIDHRPLVYTYPVGQLQVNNIELVGSCCTLIAAYVTDAIALNDKTTLMKMLRGVILVDTECLLPNNGKTTQKDVDTVEKIEKLLSISALTRTDVYQFLCQAKIDISGFSVAMMVDRDLKMLSYKWNDLDIRIAMPTLISIDVEDLLAIKDLEDQLVDILTNLNANVFIGLTCGTSSLCRRGYLIYSKYIDLNDKMARYVQLPEHKLQLYPAIEQLTMRGFYQNDVRITRKLFIPIIDKFFNSVQTNNSNSEGFTDMYLTIQASESATDIHRAEVADLEIGAPYTLNTPLRSYSGSPDNRNTEMPLPTLNNRYTQKLVDQKRQKHHAEMNEEIDVNDMTHNLEQNNNDNISPPAFTPENSDDESNPCSSNDDNIGPLPSFNYSLSVNKAGEMKQTLEALTKDLNATITNECKVSSKEHSNFHEEDGNYTEFASLAEKVNKKRQKLQTAHLNSIACSLVNDVLNSSENIVLDDFNIESFLDDWSECYSEDEKREIVRCVHSNDITRLAQLLTTSLINDCLSVPDSTECADPATGVTCDDDWCDYCQDDDDNMLPVFNNFYDSCHMGNIINEENQCILSNNVSSSSADLVENISFNLYRRISSNQVNYSDNERELLISAGDWLPKEDVIYSDPEYDEQSDYFEKDDGINNAMSMKMISLDSSTNSL